jgi:AcrR family transcriptional regulator
MMTREAIAQVTREILDTEGATAVSMRRVAKQLGITAMALYRHYRNREELLKEVCDTAFNEIAQEWRNRIQHSDPWEDLLAAGDHLIDFALHHPHLYHYMFLEQRINARRFPDDFGDGQSPTIALIISALERGMEKGSFRKDNPVLTALTVAAQLQGLIALYQSGRIGLSEEGFRELCHDCCTRLLNGLKADLRKEEFFDENKKSR